MTTGRKIAAAALAALFLVTGCGKAAEKLAEKATGCKNIDAGGGKAECNGVKFDASGNAKVPSDFPKELAPPNGVKLLSAASTSTGGLKTWILIGAVNGKVADVVKELTNQYKKAGYEVSDSSVSSGSTGAGARVTAKNGKYEVSVGVGTASSGSANSDQGNLSFSLTARELSADERASTASSSSNDSSSSSDDTGSSSSSSGGSSTGGGSTSIGEGVPDGFPSDLAPPKGAKVVNGIKNTSNGKDTYVVSYGVDDDVKTAYDKVKAQIKSAGYDVTADQLTTAGTESFGTLQGTKGGSSVNVIVGSDSSSSSGKKTVVTLNTEG